MPVLSGCHSQDEVYCRIGTIKVDQARQTRGISVYQLHHRISADYVFHDRNFTDLL